MDFLLAERVAPEPLRAAVAAALGLAPGDVAVIGDIEEILEIANTPVVIQLMDAEGEFPSHVATYRTAFEIADLQRVSAALNTRALTGDDGVNPFSYLLVDPDGGIEPVFIEARDDDEFWIVGARAPMVSE